jgi:hypothetical protein
LQNGKRVLIAHWQAKMGYLPINPKTAMFLSIIGVFEKIHCPKPVLYPEKAEYTFLLMTTSVNSMMDAEKTKQPSEKFGGCHSD